AEDGIRDRTVTGVQTCALPIFNVGAARGAGTGKTADGCPPIPRRPRGIGGHPSAVFPVPAPRAAPTLTSCLRRRRRRVPIRQWRSEERRVGKESVCAGEQAATE